MEIIELGDDWAKVLVTEQTAQNAIVYRQTRLYQYTAAGWQRVQPISNHWGKAQQLESRYFIFQYFAQDADAVEAVAARLDALYPVFYTALLPGPLPPEKVQVQIVPTLPSGEGEYESAYEQPLMVRSPAAMRVPAEMQGDEALLQSVALALFDRLSARAVDLLDLPVEWFAIRNALRLWLFSGEELPLARWRKPLVQWISSDAQIADVTQGVSAHPFADELCTSYQLWMVSPIDFGIPIVCFDRSGAGQEDSWANSSEQPTPEQLTPAASAVALATLFEYLGTTYGNDKVRATAELIAARARWAALIPAIYGVSEEEVEAGWRAFLAEQYDVDVWRYSLLPQEP